MGSSKWASLMQPSEVMAMLQMKFGGYVKKTYQKMDLDDLAVTLDDREFCYAVLVRVSRSFAVVIQQLPECLQDAVCIFYLVLRALDSIEDDMAFTNQLKVPLLKTFYQKLDIPDWNLAGVGDSSDYRKLLKHFPKVLRVYKKLDEGYQAAIADITKRMGVGMASFANKKTSIDTVDNYNLYCHYVAGLVGYGLSDLFVASGLEDPKLVNEHELSNCMGLLLQKTNIIRDYLEDLVEGRTWWPQEIWGLYAADLGFFRTNPTAEKSLACLNHMVTDALSHVPGCLRYMSMLKDTKILHFCAIPQVMAIGTLSNIYNNTKVFSSVVKMRKGLSCKVMLDATTYSVVKQYFYIFADKLEMNLPNADPNLETATKLIKHIKDVTPEGQIVAQEPLKYKHFVVFALALLTFFSLSNKLYQFATGSLDITSLTDSTQAVALVGLEFGTFCMAWLYLLGALGNGKMYLMV